MMHLTARPVSGKPVLFISASIAWSVRNYFQTGLVDALTEHFDVVVITTEGIRKEIERQGFGRGVDWIVLEVRPEPQRWRLARQLKKKIYVEGRRSRTEHLWARHTKRPFYQRAGGKVIQAATRVSDPAKLFAMVERADFQINRDARTRTIFAERRPAIFFATHASTFFEESLLRSAIAEGVPVVFMVLSWDHLSSKVLLSAKYDGIFVWNDVTKREILDTYPSYRPSQISIVGAPQFDIYAEPPTTSYETWCRTWKLDPSRRTVLFTTAPDVRHEQQHIVARDLLEEMLRCERMPPDLQLFIKCHPFDANRGYEELVGRYPVTVYRPAAGVASAQEQWVPSIQELSISRDCLVFCSVNINVFSTVTLEAAYLDKPIVHLAFDPQPVTHRIPSREYYTFDHFKRIVDMDASTLAYSHDDLVRAVGEYLAKPAHKAMQRKRVADMFLGGTVGRSSTLLRTALVERVRDLQPIERR